MMQKFSTFLLFRFLGWRMIGQPPEDVDKYLFVALPHTSNWDFFYGWLVSKSLDINMTFFVKDAYFIWPLKPICRWFGVAPVNRRESNNFVDSVAEEFKQREKLVALITPEGTRSAVAQLKSGYYYLAKAADVPIVLAGPHYKDKTLTFMPPRPAKATFEADHADLIAFCSTMDGRHPQNTFPK